MDVEVLREPSVKFYMNQALDMMNRAVGGTFQPGARENMAYFVSTEKRHVLYLHKGTQFKYCTPDRVISIRVNNNITS